MPHPESPLLSRTIPGLPVAAYRSADWHARERDRIWRREWVYGGRLADLAPGSMRPVSIGGAGVILARSGSGDLRAWHNACQHRGAELCQSQQRLGRLITCPYHGWAYAAEDGRLVSTAFATPAADFNRAAHGLKPVAQTLWNGLMFLSLATDPPPFVPDLGVGALDNWPMADLVTGHRATREIGCNWKIFWENYNECLHCPGIHSALSDRVPVYGRGLMAANEAPDWAPDAAVAPTLADGAVSWTPDGRACGPEFPNLTQAERDAGAVFVTLYPATYVVAHPDHVRVVSLSPTGPETTRLTAEWLFPAATLAQPGFDAAAVASFAMRVIEEDSAAAEMNQRGLASPGFERATLMPQEFDIHRFHGWVLERLEGETP
jgi:Rieske 2Fe-2S family protein